jgi:tetratricopeptide (TPR) repeat protein
MTTDGDEPGPALAALDALEESVRQHGAPTDHVVRQLARARLLRRQGEVEPAGEAVDLAIRAGASEPRLLALVATEGRRAGRLLRAQQAATAAVSGAPDNTDFRKLLAEIQLARRDGRGALSTLAELDAADPDVLAMRGAAALLLDTDEALRAAVAGLDAQVAAAASSDSGESSVEVRALRLRMHARLGDDVLAEARALAREVPGDAGVALALGEAALAARQADTAVEALGQAVRSSPDDAEGHYLLGRARRMAGDGEGAEQSFRRALELLPEHADARFALGGLLLDMGSYEAADTLYAELGRSSRSAGGQAATVAGRLGRVEALTGLGRLDDATVQLEGLQADARALPSTRLAAARLALARGRAGDALTEVRPLATAEGASAAVLALYADALLAAGQAEPAADAYAAAIAADGGLPEALLGQAEMAVRSDRDDDALALLTQLGRALETRIRPPALRARMHLLRGRAHLLGGRNSLAPAREALREAVAIEGAPAAAHFFLGEALAGEDSQGARAAYERYLELAPEGEYAARARRAIRR